MTDSPPDPTAELPRYRQVWEGARLADAAWCHALQAHQGSNDPVTLPDRLAITAAAADTCARTLTRAAAIGLAWNPFPGPPSRHQLPGELGPEQRPEHPDGWIALAGAAERLAEASCQRDPEQLVQAFQLFAQTCNYLRGQITPAR
ncbi:MAG: hypothetical protein AB7G37_10805 [Solirubrobacteraceae bacterium]